MLDQLLGVAYSFTQPIDMRLSEMIVGVRGDVAIKVFEPDLATLNDLPGQIKRLAKEVKLELGRWPALQKLEVEHVRPGSRRGTH